MPAETNPLLTESVLPFGMPDFSAIEVAHLKPALLKGIEEEKRQWQEIGDNPAPATVENTVIAVDAAGEVLDRASAVFWTLLSSVGGTELEDLQQDLAATFARHGDDFWLNPAIYKRYQQVAELEDLDEETAWLVQEMLRAFRRSGVTLQDEQQQELRALNAQIATLQAQIDTAIVQQLQRAGTSGDDLAELEGLTDSEISAAAEAGKEVGRGWRLGVANYSQPPQIASLANPETRARVLHNSINRGFGTKGDEGGAAQDLDTRPLILELAAARAKRAQLLGFPSHADLVVSEETVPSVAAVRDLLGTVAAEAGTALSEQAEIYGDRAQQDGTELTVSDWLYYEGREQAANLGVNPEDLKAYLELDRVIQDGVFYAAHELYGLDFVPRPDVVGWDADVEAWEVRDQDGEPLGLFLADWYARPGKNGGAWMSGLKSGNRRTGDLPIVTNNTNFAKPAPGMPTLLSWDDVETCFHEFGHALHGLLSDTYYQGTAGTNVPRDFVELPSQLNEMWAYHPQVLGRFARHWETGEPLDGEVLDALVRSMQFGQAFSTMEYVQAALIDQGWHGPAGTLPEHPDQVETFEGQTLQAGGADNSLVAPRYRTPYFAHAFAGGYDAAYYSYMWAEAMVGELEEWLRGPAAQNRPANSGAEGTNETATTDGGLNRQAGAILRDQILSRGNSRPPLDSFTAVLGRHPSGEAVIRRRGLAGPVS